MESRALELARLDGVDENVITDFENYLILPVQKAPRYVLLLNELKRRTLPCHGEYELLHSAIAAMLSVTNTVNSAVAAEKNRLQVQRFLLDFDGGPPAMLTGGEDPGVSPNRSANKDAPTPNRQNSTSIDLMHPSHTLLKVGMLTHLSRRTEVQASLFSDVLVLSRRKRKAKLEFVNTIDLVECTVTALPDTSTTVRKSDLH